MDKELKKKLKYVVIGFCILLIPIGFFLKYSYGVELNNSASNTFWQRGYGDKKIGLESIEKLEKAKRYCKRNKIVYYNQSRIQSILGDNETAIKTIDQLLVFQPNNIYALRLQGFYYELNNQIDKANDNYKKVRKLLIEQGTEHKDYEFTLLITDLLLNDTTDFSKKINEFTLIYGNDPIYGMIIEKLKDFDRVEYIKQQIR